MLRVILDSFHRNRHGLSPIRADTDLISWHRKRNSRIRVLQKQILEDHDKFFVASL